MALIFSLSSEDLWVLHCILLTFLSKFLLSFRVSCLHLLNFRSSLVLRKLNREHCNVKLMVHWCISLASVALCVALESTYSFFSVPPVPSKPPALFLPTFLSRKPCILLYWEKWNILDMKSPNVLHLYLQMHIYMPLSVFPSPGYNEE